MIKFYGAFWCSDCQRAKFILDHNKIEYEYINIDEDEEASEYVKKVNNGNRSIPTLIFEDESILVEPTTEELIKKLGIEAG
ncbi:MAG: glutathione S-transferase N-terminal domain-containing protein, partial [Romboutsia sp.]|nr:glutathione S-transferase N-terminal domain-containing protein [Romboutsia sp.]